MEAAEKLYAVRSQEDKEALWDRAQLRGSSEELCGESRGE